MEFPWPVLPAVKSHHEKWDGSGYPEGLSGEEIPLTARILAVADVYDALTSERSCRSAWPHGKALAEIQRCAGSHFDPAVVEAFTEVVGRVTADGFEIFGSLSLSADEPLPDLDLGPCPGDEEALPRAA